MASLRKQAGRLKQESDNIVTLVMVTAVVGTLGLVASIF